jgi:Ni,Fe-hydrogenase III component G
MSVHVDATSFWTSEEDGKLVLNVGRYEAHADGNYYHDYALDYYEARALWALLDSWLAEQRQGRSDVQSR